MPDSSTAGIYPILFNNLNFMGLEREKVDRLRGIGCQVFLQFVKEAMDNRELKDRSKVETGLEYYLSNQDLAKLQSPKTEST